ncbi:Uncharacterized protein HZ326_27383 [Fusarium oxysporum f. sp. albedinis]|nr:Uncharacterized protein HZ326_27383 [Fusarium oxysporum f. sp. albedinis]
MITEELTRAVDKDREGWRQAVKCRKASVKWGVTDECSERFGCQPNPTSWASHSLCEFASISQTARASRGASATGVYKSTSNEEVIFAQIRVIAVFTQLLHTIPGCKFIADGLDECAYLDNSSASVKKFIHDVTNAVVGTHARVLFVSRDEPEIRQALIEDAPESFAEYKIMPGDVRSDTAVFSRDIVNRKLQGCRQINQIRLGRKSELN